MWLTGIENRNPTTENDVTVYNSQPSFFYFNTRTVIYFAKIKVEKVGHSNDSLTVKNVFFLTRIPTDCETRTICPLATSMFLATFLNLKLFLNFTAMYT